MSSAADTLPAPPRAVAGGGGRDRFLAFAFAAADMLVETGLDGLITFAAGAFRVRFGADGSRFLGQHVASLIAPGDQTAFAMALSAMPLRGRIAPIRLRTSDAGQTPSVLSAMLVPDPPGRMCFTLGAVPVSGPEPVAGGQMQDKLRFSREAESLLRAGGQGAVGLLELKGLPALRERMSPEAQRRLREEIGEVLAGSDGRMLASEIADGRYGVLAGGEQDIQALAGTLTTLLRGSPATRQARVEGTGLALAHEGLTAPRAARALRYALSRFAEAGSEAVAAIGANGGLAGILAQADLKARGVQEMIAHGRFRLAFQPVVGLVDRKVHHYEALLRPIPTPGSPGQSTQDFVTFAEAVGLSEALDWAVLDQVLVALRAAPAVRVAVNVSGLSMQSAEFRGRMLERVGELAALLGGRGAGPAARGRLLVELTETAEIEDMQGAAASIAALRRAGVPVCLDDFGAGSAAFRYLRAFQVDYVKIDGAYVRAAQDSARERGFVSAMVELAGSVGAEVVAEMIETPEQAALMQELGVHHGQGWLFGRPGRLPGQQR